MWEGVGAAGRAERGVLGVLGEDVGDQLGLSVRPREELGSHPACSHSPLGTGKIFAGRMSGERLRRYKELLQLSNKNTNSQNEWAKNLDREANFLQK